MNLLGFHLLVGPLNVQMILLIFIMFAGFSFILGLRLTGRVARIKPAEALSQVSDVMAAQQSTFKFPFFFGKPYWWLASRTIRRSWYMAIQSITFLGVVIALMTVIVVGGIVAEETALNYFQRAVGTDVVLVAKTEMAEHYEQLLDRFLQPSQSESFNYLNDSYAIPDSVISAIQEISGVIEADPG